ncbi:M23 family metallopeptidase [Saccharopolyspora taberi]|uniref:M23ase beta-sheet core domain-containing protein n=1 Tax=Saccharopolyspora taberi TaxID=60895 RepID=A0ABN3V8D0_9PSEU
MRSLLPALLMTTLLTSSAAAEPAAPQLPEPTSFRRLLLPAAPDQLPEPTAFDRPLPGPVTRPFEEPAHAYGPGHRGVDLAGEAGQPVLAAGPGLVLFAGPLAGRNLVSIEHPGGLRTTYEPVSPAVTVGQEVGIGQPIGRLDPGHPECSAPPPQVCLHWGARRRLHYLDPLQLLGTARIRLLPWEDKPSR